LVDQVEESVPVVSSWEATASKKEMPQKRRVGRSRKARKKSQLPRQQSQPVKLNNPQRRPGSSTATADEQALTEKGASASTENQPGRAEGEAAKEEALKDSAQQGQGVAAKQEKSNGVKATEESERFSEESGITVDQAGNAQNLGGNLGITQGSDGSKSVGGENGINIAASGEAAVAGNE